MSSSSSAQNYAGFKLGEKKKFKENEVDFEVNLARLRQVLGDAATVTIDWASFEPKLASDSTARTWAGKYLMSIWFGSIVREIVDDEKTFGKSTLSNNISSIIIHADQSGTSDRFVPSLVNKTLTVAINVARIEYDGTDGKLASWLGKNMSVSDNDVMVGGISLKGFGLQQIEKIKQALPAYETAQACLASAFGAGVVTITVDAPGFAQRMPESDKMWFGAWVLDQYCSGVAREMAELAKDTDYKEAIVDAIKSISLVADRSGIDNGRFTPELKDGCFKLTLNPDKVRYGYDADAKPVMAFLKKAF